tara:strand:- start:21502 stop:21804 length:303 start_codon:yes stop_codon:yes gene_type:complete
MNGLQLIEIRVNQIFERIIFTDFNHNTQQLIEIELWKVLQVNIITKSIYMELVDNGLSLSHKPRYHYFSLDELNLDFSTINTQKENIFVTLNDTLEKKNE